MLFQSAKLALIFGISKEKGLNCFNESKKLGSNHIKMETS